jgi:stage II sporulation SpoE-like protein
MGLFPLQQRTWPRLVHATILLALAFVLGAGFPVAEAKQGSNQSARKSARSEARHARATPARRSQRVSASASGDATGSGQQKIVPQEPVAEQPPRKQPAKAPSTAPQDTTANEPTGRPSTKQPSQPSSPVVTSPTPPTLRPVTQLPSPVAVGGAGSIGKPETSGSSRRQGARGTLRRTSRAGRAAASALRPRAALTRISDLAAKSKPAQAEPARKQNSESAIARTVRDIVEVVPDSLKKALAAMAALSLLLGGWALFSGFRSRRLARQRSELLREVGLLQSALLPPVPEVMGALHTSVAYRPADGPGAGGDFYDALPLPGGRVAFILGDISGHGRGALERTAFMRYTLRAYLEAGLEPRVTLQVAGRVIDEHLGNDFATVLIAVHDPATGSLTYASAGHPTPIVVGPSAYEPVLAASSPPIGVGVRTGLRQTSVPLAPGSVACLYTDGLTEARTDHGLIGRGRLSDLVAELGGTGSAEELLRRVAGEARLVSDDMAACLISPTAGVTAGGFRSEQLELSRDDLGHGLGERFLNACGVPREEAEQTLREAADLARTFGGAVLHVGFGNRLTVEALPRNVESLEAASRRSAAAEG